MSGPLTQPKSSWYPSEIATLTSLKRRVDSVGQSLRNGARMLITGNPIFDREGNIKLVAVIEREITDLDTMLVELEATKDKMRAVEAVDRRHQREIEHLRKDWSNAKLIGESRQIREILALAVKPETRVRLGESLAALGRKLDLGNEDFELFEQVRDKVPAEPLRFE